MKAVSENKKRTETEMRRLRDENARLRAEADCVDRTRDCADAFRRGVEKGRTSPITEAERFARTFEGRRVEFRTQKDA